MRVILDGEAEGSAMERGDIEAAVGAVLDAWLLPDAPAALRERVAAMQRHAVIAGAGHLAPLDRPEAFRELLLDFLSESAARDTQRGS